MKRSDINTIMRDADAFIRKHGFHLPPCAYWSPADWATKGEQVREIVDNQMTRSRSCARRPRLPVLL